MSPFSIARLQVFIPFMFFCWILRLLFLVSWWFFGQMSFLDHFFWRIWFFFFIKLSCHSRKLHCSSTWMRKSHIFGLSGGVFTWIKLHFDVSLNTCYFQHPLRLFKCLQLLNFRIFFFLLDYFGLRQLLRCHSYLRLLGYNLQRNSSLHIIYLLIC